MPLYEYRCRTCDETFELRRPMSDSQPALPSARRVTSIFVRLLSVFSSVGAAVPARLRRPHPLARGGVCGSSCGCHH